MECRLGSTLPADVSGLGYEVTETGEDERILGGAIVEKFVARANRKLKPLTEGSTGQVAHTVTHAGICRVRRYRFDIP